MAKRRTTKRAPVITKKRKKKALNSILNPKLVWLFTFLLFILFLGLSIYLKDDFIQSRFDANCQKPNSGALHSNIIFNTMNLNHSVVETPSNIYQLRANLTDDVSWYGKGNEILTKDKITSPYDCFCFSKASTEPIFHKENGIVSLNIYGFHRYRNINWRLVEPENLYIEFKENQISLLKVSEISSLDESRIEKLNWMYLLYIPAVLILSLLAALLLVLFGFAFFYLPDYKFRTLIDFLKLIIKPINF